jgi:hypothetical protein
MDEHLKKGPLSTKRALFVDKDQLLMCFSTKTALYNLVMVWQSVLSYLTCNSVVIKLFFSFITLLDIFQGTSF